MHVARSFRLDKVLSHFRRGMRQHVINVEVLFEWLSIDHPNKIFIKFLPGFSLRIRHCGVLDLDVDPVWRLDVRPMDFPVLCDMRDFPAFFGKVVLPLAVPFGLVLPPGIAVASSFMGPMMNNAGTTLGHYG